VGYLRQVVEIQAQVVGSSAGLRSPVLDDLQVCRLAELLGFDEPARTSVSMVISSSLPTVWIGRCSPGGATIVRQLPDARAWAIATWARLRSISRASPWAPTTLNA
jgi:hypothetical protein